MLSSTGIAVVAVVIALIIRDLLQTWLGDQIDKFITWLMSFERMTNFTWE